MVKNKDMQFFMENLKMKRQKDKNVLTFLSRDLNPRFSVIFPPWFEFFCEVKSPRSNKNKFLKKIGLYCPELPNVPNRRIYVPKRSLEI